MQALALALAVLPAGAAPNTPLHVTLGTGGLQALDYNGVSLLGDGHLRVNAATLETWDGTRSPGDVQHATVRTDPVHSAVTQTYPWGVVRCAYRPAPDRLALTVTVTDTSDKILRGVSLQLLSLAFPRTPAGFDGTPRWTHNIGTPSVVTADCGAATVALCNDDVGRPLLFGLPYATDPPAKRTYPLWVSSVNQNWLSPYLDPLINRPIYPGDSDTYHLSLRFAPAGAPSQALTGDLPRRFAAAYPFQLHWPDRRPIGQLVLSSSDALHDSKTNPRGWLQDPTVDTTTDAGRAEFRRRLLAYADNSIRILKAMDAQGMITWDTEGQQYPHAISYLGDPRSLPPEMQGVVDEYYKRFRDAGLRTGLCLRPSRPVRMVYDDRPVWQQDVADMFANLRDKIAYARQRWGCTLFYVDSNGDPNVPFDALLFKRLADAFPDVLLVPEHKNVLYHAYTAPYSELRQGYAGTNPAVSAVYPGAFDVICVSDGPLAQRRADLTAAVRRGDILLFRAWFDSDENTLVRQIYQEAQRSP